MHTVKLKKRLNEIFLLLGELELLKSDIKHLSNKEEEYFIGAVEKSRFLHRTYMNCIKLMIIDANKILSPKEHFGLYKTINYCLTNRTKIEWYKNPSNQFLEELKTKVSDLIEKHFEKIKQYRDKYYVHLDKNKDDLKYDLKLLDVYEIIEKTQDIYRTLNSYLIGSDSIFSIWNQPPMEFKNLYKYNLLRKDITNNLLNGVEKIEIEKYWKIIQ